MHTERRIGPVPNSWVLVIAVTSLGLILGLRDARAVLFDDAAITFRYAWRIAHGHGFTYNDGDRTNGASAPLYTLLLASLSRAGLDLESTASNLGAICYSAACGLVAWLGQRLGGLATGLIASLLLLSSTDFRLLSLSGMESSFAVVIGLAALAFVIAERPVIAGVLVGLAIVNKLDAGLLAAAILIAFFAVQRRFPVRLAIAAVATAAPWLMFATWYFGSPVPYSATQKLTEVKDPSYHADPLWILRTLGGDRELVPLLLAVMSLLLVPLLKRQAPALATTLVAMVSWACLHLVFFSLANFGDPYPWYVTVVYPLVSLGAAVLLVRAPNLLSVPSWRHRVVVLAWCVGLGLVALPKASQLWKAASVVARGHNVDGYEQLDGTRRSAGRYLGRAAAPGEVVATCFGWIAFGAPTNPIEETCPLSTRRSVASPTWGVELEWPDSGPLRLPNGATDVASFDSEGSRPGRTIVFRFDGR